ncbi:hypothetical protein QBC47DRAFT_59390 [Echria macrotheca]|uniref:DUF8004 domain-containing protein n=1 Tax=Echria macrotheca TaxID=438768 RepID=A0AAJ0B8R0_9PEZI|nr:hypothetical protein QBC47DRAFT_59390 [Echria macrotheca]
MASGKLSPAQIWMPPQAYPGFPITKEKGTMRRVWLKTGRLSPRLSSPRAARVLVTDVASTVPEFGLASTKTSGGDAEVLPVHGASAREAPGRRTSCLGIVAVCFPILTSSPADPPGASSSRSPNRRPVTSDPYNDPNTASNRASHSLQPPGFSQQSPYAQGYPTPVYGYGLPQHQQPGYPPPNVPLGHARNASFPLYTQGYPSGYEEAPNQPTQGYTREYGEASSPPASVPSLTTTSTSPPTQVRGRGRSHSPIGKLQSNRLQPQLASPPAARIRSSSARPASSHSSDETTPTRSVTPSNVPQSSASSDGADSPGSKLKRRSWLPGGRSRSNSDDTTKAGQTGAWIIAPHGRADYSTANLVNAEKVPELWNEAGSVCVYLFPREAGKGPSFKVADHVFGSSAVLYELLLSGATGRSGNLLTVGDATRRQSLPRQAAAESQLYLPLHSTDLEMLVAARNLFAFLTNQPLVCTNSSPTLFSCLLKVAELLRQFGFSSYDGSSFGDEVDRAFGLLMEQFQLANVKDSREKTLERLVLAEYMRSWPLYYEVFTHAVGKYDAILARKSPLYEQLSINTRNRLERAHLELFSRQKEITQRLDSFEFPSLFAGIASSTSVAKTIKFKEWRNAFAKMRSFVLGYYKNHFGHWPPKAKSKKSPFAHFSHGGLNRQVLRILYWDFCSLYDLLVDRESRTPRNIAVQLPRDTKDSKDTEDSKDSKDSKGAEETEVIEIPWTPISALRKMLTEFDEQSPPVIPPIPYDIPKLPSMTAIHEKYNELSTKQQAKLDKKLQTNELLLLLHKARNYDTDSCQRPFLDAFKDFELKEARSVSPQDLADQRIGYWLFIYAVMQSLPMLVIDAPDLKFSEGVEYFLCQAPQGNPAWSEDAGEVRKMWYRAGGGTNLVQLSTDVVLFSVEGTYSRSHCWLAAKRFDAAAAANNPAVIPPQPGSGEVGLATSPLEPPRSVFKDMDPVSNPSANTAGDGSPGSASPADSPHLRPRSQHAQHAYRMSMAMGLEPLRPGDVPPPQPGDRSSRVVSGSAYGHGHGSRQSSISGLSGTTAQGSGVGLEITGSTFDDILKSMESDKKEKKKKFFG